MDKMNPYFNPDELKLDKDIYRNIINAIIQRWKKASLKLVKSTLSKKRNDGIS